jgi:hypothetical protein
VKINYYSTWKDLVEIRKHHSEECLDVIIYEIILDAYENPQQIEWANIFYHGETIGKVLQDNKISVYDGSTNEIKILSDHIDEITERISDFHNIKDILE